MPCELGAPGSDAVRFGGEPADSVAGSRRRARDRTGRGLATGVGGCAGCGRTALALAEPRDLVDLWIACIQQPRRATRSSPRRLLSRQLDFDASCLRQRLRRSPRLVPEVRPRRGSTACPLRGPPPSARRHARAARAALRRASDCLRSHLCLAPGPFTLASDPVLRSARRLTPPSVLVRFFPSSLPAVPDPSGRPLWFARAPGDARVPPLQFLILPATATAACPWPSAAGGRCLAWPVALPGSCGRAPDDVDTTGVRPPLRTNSSACGA